MSQPSFITLQVLNFLDTPENEDARQKFGFAPSRGRDISLLSAEVVAGAESGFFDSRQTEASSALIRQGVVASELQTITKEAARSDPRAGGGSIQFTGGSIREGGRDGGGTTQDFQRGSISDGPSTGSSGGTSQLLDGGAQILIQ